MLKLITNPDEFFAELKQRKPNLVYPILIVTVLAILASVGQYLVISKFSQDFPPEIAKFMLIISYIGVATSFIVSFIVWLIIAVILYAISSVFGGEGEFKRTLEFTGYGFVPNIVGSCITLPLTAHYLSRAEIPMLGAEALRDPEVMKSIIQAIFPTEAIYAFAIVNFAMLLWSLTIWSFALKHARGLSLKNAFITALIPTALYCIYQLWSILKYVL